MSEFYKPYRKDSRQWLYRTPDGEVAAGDNEEQSWAQARAAKQRDEADCRNPQLRSMHVNALRSALNIYPNAKEMTPPLTGGVATGKES